MGFSELHLRGDIKYYYANFVRKGSTPPTPPPFTEKIRKVVFDVFPKLCKHCSKSHIEQRYAQPKIQNQCHF